jgi:L-2-hydroxyglutarate oxidase LhgO
LDEARIIIIGAGVIGLSIAARLSKSYSDIIVIERNDSFGRETSSRNSEVIHSGLYYPSPSLKTTLCKRGSIDLYEFCEKMNVPYKKTGKLIVASTDDEIPALERLINAGIKNELKGIEIVDKKQIYSIEKEVNAVAGIFLPQTGIINSHVLMHTLYQAAISQSVMFAFNTECTEINQMKDGYVLGFKNDDYKIKSKIIINCAGLASARIAACVDIDIEKKRYNIYLCKGSYFSYLDRLPITHLVYPVPHNNLAGLGVHATIDMSGKLRFGPDVEYIDEIDYQIDPSKQEVFFQSARKIFNNLDGNKLSPDMAGIRPKLSAKDEPFRDFVISEEADLGLPGFINLIGIESPGLTSCLAIADYVLQKVKECI